MEDISVQSRQQNVFSPLTKTLDQETTTSLMPPLTLWQTRAQVQAEPVDEQIFLCPDLKAGTLERSSEGYQPQNELDILFRKQISQEPQSPLPSSPYIQLPQSDP